MEQVSLTGIYAPSQDIVAREIEGEMIIVPLTSGIGDIEEQLFSLNATGRVIWKYLDGKNSLQEVVGLIVEEFDAPDGEIENDVVGFVTELLNRKIVYGVFPQ